MSTSGNLLVSPVGQLQFMAVNHKVTKNKQKDSPEGHAVKIKFDSNTPEGAAWKTAIEAINPGIIGVKHIDKKGEFTVRAFTQFDVSVYNSDGTEMETRPNFYTNSTGTAQMIVQPNTQNDLGGSIYLVGVVLHNLDIGEQAGTNTKDDALATIREQLKNAAASKL